MNASLVNSVSSEFRLVAACSWMPKNTESQSSLIVSLSSESLNWEKVASLVNRHGIAGSFCQVMDNHGWLNVPETTKARLKALRRHQTVRALGQVAELARIGKFFATTGVDVVPLKGVVLSQELYGDFSIRSSSDLDILVRGKDVAKAEELLVLHGYRHSLGFHCLGAKQQQHIIKALHHHEYINDERGIHLELHWRSFLWGEKQVNSLWDNSSSTSLFAVTLCQLSKLDNILFLADHGSGHGWCSLKWLSDLAMLLEDISTDDWDSLYERAAYFDLQRVLLQTVILLQWIYGIELSSGAKKLLTTDKLVVKLAFNSTKHLFASAEEYAQQLKQFYGLKSVIRYKQLKPSTPITSLLRNLLLAHSDFLILPLPNALFWLYVPLRPFFWIKRHYLTPSKYKS